MAYARAFLEETNAKKYPDNQVKLLKGIFRYALLPGLPQAGAPSPGKPPPSPGGAGGTETAAADLEAAVLGWLLTGLRRGPAAGSSQRRAARPWT